MKEIELKERLEDLLEIMEHRDKGNNIVLKEEMEYHRLLENYKGTVLYTYYMEKYNMIRPPSIRWCSRELI